MPKIFKDRDNNVLYEGYETNEIVANPVLAGTEDDLTGLQVGDTKFKVGGGTQELYGISFEAVNGSNRKTVQLLCHQNTANLDSMIIATSPLPQPTQSELQAFRNFFNRDYESCWTIENGCKITKMDDESIFYMVITDESDTTIVEFEIDIATWTITFTTGNALMTTITQII